MKYPDLQTEIRFADENCYEQMQDLIAQEVAAVLDDAGNTADALDQMLFSAFGQLVPVMKIHLDYKALEDFAELTHSFACILECRQRREKRPYALLDRYKKLCYDTAFIFDDQNWEECPEYLAEKVPALYALYWEERETKDNRSRIIACSWCSVFAAYHFFLGYLSADGRSRKNIADICQTWIPHILFDILWSLDRDLGNSPADSFFLKAVKDIFHGLFPMGSAQIFSPDPHKSFQ